MFQNFFTKKQVIDYSDKIKKIQEALIEADGALKLPEQGKLKMAVS